MSTVKTLFEKVSKYVDSPRNRHLASLWKPQLVTARDHWRGTPKLEKVAVTVEPENPLWAKIIGFNIKDFYTDPDTYLKNTLKINLYRFLEFQDDTPLSKIIPIWLGAGFEHSFFGLDPVFLPGRSPWIPKTPIIINEQDLDSLNYPDFYRSGLMPRAHEFFERISRLVHDSDFTVTFPEWARGPFGLAGAIRGWENLLKDMITAPDFVHRLMKFFNGSRIRWARERARFLGSKIEKANLYNDEVNVPLLSPLRYEKFVLPYEKEICDFFGGLLYWHSCGNISPLLELIREIPTIDMLHVGPWTDLPSVINVFRGTPLEICLNPLSDVMLATELEMRSRIEYIMNTCKGNPFTIRADGIHPAKSVKHDVAQIKRWLRVAREVVDKQSANKESLTVK